MIGWIIFGCIMLALLALLLVPVSVSLSVADNAPLNVRWHILFFGFALYPKKKRRYRRMSAKAWQKKKQKAAQKKAKRAVRKDAHPKKKRGVRDYLRLAKLLLSLLKRTHRGLLSTFRLRICRAHLAIGTEDAAKTAITYGIAAQLLAALLEVTDQFLRTRHAKESVRIYPDFCAQTTKFDIHLYFTSNLLRLLMYALRAAIAFMQIKAEQAQKTNKQVEDTNHG